MGRRILNDALSTIVNAEKRGFASAQLQPISNVISSFLTIMKHRGYVKNFEVHDPHRVGKINVELLGRIKGCRAITYRQDIKAHEIENYRLRTLPTQQWGYVVITTPNGVLDHEEAIRQNVGGQVLGYVKNFEVHDPHRVGKINVELLGRIKGCRAITYRQDIKAHEIENYRLRTLPTQQWGYVVITTPNGVLDHEEAIRQNVGGQVLGYFY